MGVSLVAQLVKNLPAMQETWVQSLGGKVPWRQGRLPTPVFWPKEFHGLYSPRDRKESDTTEQLSLLLHWRKMTELGTYINAWFHNFAQPFLKETSCIDFSWKGFSYLYYANWTLFLLLLKKEILFLSDNSSPGKEDSNYWDMARINSALYSERHPYQMLKTLGTCIEWVPRKNDLCEN